ncbi:MAG: hypothetical protein SFT81_01965 [Candidatus Caenarcaniphilales bacterium]|nr:hypothetical protein [Candidatus Caenarcaniphilales bacterium]
MVSSVSLQSSGRLSPTGIFEMLKKAPKFTLVTALLPVLLAPIGLPGIFNSDLLKDPRHHHGEGLLARFGRWTGEIFPEVFDLYMLNNFAQAAVWASPSKILSYGIALPFTFQNGFRNHRLTKIADQIRRLREKLEEVDPKDLHMQAVIQAQIDHLMKEGADLNAKIGFFGKAIYTALLIPTFVAILPFISRFTRHCNGKELYHIRPAESFQNPKKYFELLFSNGKKELECLKNSLGEFGKLGEINYAKINSVPVQEKAKMGLFDQAMHHFSAGFLPSALQLTNIALRIMAISGFGLTLAKGGLTPFNDHSPYDSSPADQKKPKDGIHSLSDQLLSICLFISGMGGLLTGMNRSFIQNNGRMSSIAQSAGSLVYGIAAGITSFKPGCSAAATYSMVFLGSILQWFGNGLGALYKLRTKI